MENKETEKAGQSGSSAGTGSGSKLGAGFRALLKDAFGETGAGMVLRGVVISREDAEGTSEDGPWKRTIYSITDMNGTYGLVCYDNPAHPIPDLDAFNAVEVKVRSAKMNGNQIRVTGDVRVVA